MEIKSVLYVILIIFIVYIILRSFQSQVRLTGLSDAKSTQEIEPSVIQDTNNPHMNFTYSIWVYVDDWNYKFGQPKIVVSRRDENTRQSPVIALDNNENSLRLMNNNSYRCDTGKTTTLLLLIINILSYRTVVPASHDDVQKKRRVKEGFHEYIRAM